MAAGLYHPCGEQIHLEAVPCRGCCRCCFHADLLWHLMHLVLSQVIKKPESDFPKKCTLELFAGKATLVLYLSRGKLCVSERQYQGSKPVTPVAIGRLAAAATCLCVHMPSAAEASL